MKSLFKKSTLVLSAAMLLFACGGKTAKKETTTEAVKTSKTIKDIYRPNTWKKAAALLVEEGNIPASDGYKPATADFIDGTTYDTKDPIGYINSFKIGNKDKRTALLITHDLSLSFI